MLVFFVVSFCIAKHSKADYPNWAFAKYVYEYGQLEKIELLDGLDLSNRNLFNNSITRRLGELRNITFDNSRLSYSALVETTFINCSFRGTNLFQVDASDTGFKDCDFTDADISKATFYHMYPHNLMQTVNYKNKDLSNIKIETWKYWDDTETIDTSCDFTGFNLENAWLPRDVEKCNFTDARINGTRLYGVRWKGADSYLPSFSKEQLTTTHNYKIGIFLGTQFSGVDFSHVDFSGMNLTGCKFEQGNTGIDAVYLVNYSNFDQTNIENAVISGCDFSGAENLTLDQIKSTWNYKVGRMEGITLPSKLQEQLDAERQVEGKSL